MAATHLPAADDRTQLPSLGRESRAFSWRALAVVACVALLLSTQIFFQAGIAEVAASGYLLEGWLALFAEVLASGAGMWLCVTLAARFTTGRHRAIEIALVAVALFAGALAAVALVLAFVQPPGFYPPFASIASDALRWSAWGAIVYAAQAQIARRVRALACLAAEELERERAQTRLAEADLQLLRAQIEPHFLFNVLAHVRRLCRTPEGGGDAIDRLCTYLREVGAAVRGADATLGRELELVRAYLALLRVTMGERLAFEIRADEGVAGQRVPALVVLTLVENAVKHGIGRCPEGGSIRVTAARGERGLRIEVRDDGAGLTGTSGTGVGLANAKARLRATFGPAARLSLGANVPRGAIAAIEIAQPS